MYKYINTLQYNNTSLIFWRHDNARWTVYNPSHSPSLSVAFVFPLFAYWLLEFPLWINNLSQHVFKIIIVNIRIHRLSDTRRHYLHLFVCNLEPIIMSRIETTQGKKKNE